MIIKEFKERPNQHQTHLESLVTLGRDGLEEINDKIEKFIRSFTGTNELNVTTKIDGSPAVVCWSKFEGYPDNSICLKSFITSNQNCLSSVQQIEERYGDREDMAEKLMYCLQLAKSIPAGEAWQGDCLYTSSNKKVIDILGKEYLTFQPNKIIYAFSENNPGYDLIKNSNFGICFHTIYKGNLEHKALSFKVDASRLLNVPSDIYVMSPVINAPKENGAYNLDLINILFSELKEVENKLISTDTYEDLCNNVVFKQYWDMFENANLSDKLAVTISEDTFYNDLKEFIHSKLKTEYDKKFASLKTEKGKLAATEKYLNSLQELDNILEYNKDVLSYLVRALNLTAKIKMLMWGGYKKSNQGYSTFYNTRSQGYIPADMEGVAMSDMEGNIVKIVDRSTFSHANRSDDYIGGWQHESLEENTSEEDVVCTDDVKKIILNLYGGAVDIELYDASNGHNYAAEYILSISSLLRGKLLFSMQVFKTFGTNTREPYTKSVSDDGIYEIMAKYGSDITIVLFFFVIGNKAIVTNGFTKKTQKTPESEINKARKLRKDFYNKR